MAIGYLGNSSVRYEIGIFKQGEDKPSAYGHFVHVFVKHSTQKPTPIIDPLRSALEKILIESH